MKCTLLFGVLVAAQVGCSSELLVLAPRERVEPSPDDADAASTPPTDAGQGASDAQLASDAGSAPDGHTERGDAARPEAGLRLLSAFAQTCAVQDGALWCWGDDARGQVGVLGNVARAEPQLLASEAFVDVCAGERHSCALRADGTAFCWGDNGRGELGVGDFQPREQPTELSSRRFRSIACGGFNTCALGLAGELLCWGENSEGKLGLGDPSPDRPGTLPNMAVPTGVSGDRRFSQVSVGQGHVCAITEGEGALYCWGRNNTGQVGVADVGVQFRAPLAVAPGSKFTRVAAGQRHSCAIDGDGKLLCWGDNRDPLLGLQTDAEIVRTPTVVGEDADYTEVDASWFHTCALKKSGTLVCWGRAEEGQLGLGDSTPQRTPTRVGPEFHWNAIAVGQFHSCAYDWEGAWCWGENSAGQLGRGDTVRRYLPSEVQFP
jgi:alpha-tubulin suppressor-like RCC1 family protein